jgi:predicted glycogen debranching enzyme
VRSSADAEWLETDGRGGFASGTVVGVRTRRYHALLLVATTPPTGRMVLVNGFEAWVTTPRGTFALTSQRYAPGVVHPDGAHRIERFEPDPWPQWTYRLEDGTVVQQEVLVPPSASAVVVAWRLAEPAVGVTLAARPLLSGRDYHALHRENPAFRFDAAVSHERVEWRPYPGVPGIVARSNARYAHRPEWYRNFEYEAERARGLDCMEDLAAPGIFTWDLSSGEAVWVLAAAGAPDDSPRTGESVTSTVRRWRAAEASRRGTSSGLARSAGAYPVRRGEGRTIIAGYPWFTDWGRDTFIAMRGLCLATGRLDAARDILVQWAGAESEGMLPNRFPDAGERPEFNAVDASLWFIVAVHDFLEASAARAWPVTSADRDALRTAVDAILDGYMQGTRYDIRCGADGLLAAGEPGVPLTWMDARVGGQAVTPRVGKPVEVQALWLNALRIGNAFSPRRLAVFRGGSRAFRARFWHEAGGHLHDVVDVDHRPGAVDASFRPNQVLAVGGLPLPLLTGTRARRVLDAVEARLLTPMGLRSLAPEDSAYVPHYQGDARERDAAYHQGTVWPWLIGPFAEAWVRARGGTAAAKREARARFLAPLLQHLDEAGVGHISEIADGDPPHTPRGCPFQAWSLGEALRLDLAVLAE